MCHRAHVEDNLQELFLLLPHGSWVLEIIIKLGGRDISVLSSFGFIFRWWCWVFVFKLGLIILPLPSIGRNFFFLFFFFAVYA